ncbi:MAG: transcriptional regulator [Propionibacteriales bacterium]|nr:transcriptional regulator [Propionibacteriales bacterium]
MSVLETTLCLVHDMATRQAALALIEQGLSLNATSKRLGVSRAALREWRDRGPTSRKRLSSCPRCQPDTDLDSLAYAYLLGSYLGDGCISELRRGVFSLRVTCCLDYPGIIMETGDAMQAVHPHGRVSTADAPGCLNVVAYWKHWPCLFPQHGPGRKHTRPIVLAPWQREIVEQHTGRFLRGLFHSDGCRFTNWTEKTVAGARRRYEYPRYMFTNRSTDILALCGWALDLLDIDWRMANARNLSVARRAAVAALDRHVGPKS